MQTNTIITSSTCHLHQDDAFEAILPLLEAEGIEVICHDNHLVDCPGQAFHTAPSAISDCKVFLNDVNGTLVPRLHCFHTSCREVLQECNLRLYRAALAGKLHVHQKHWKKSGGTIPNQILIARSIVPTVQELLAQYAWTFDDIINDARGKVNDPPQLHYIYILSLFKDHEVVWIGRDLYDTGGHGHVWRFRTVEDWCADYPSPGVFTCPSSFKPGVHSRSDANVLNRNFLVVESDELTRDQVGAVFRWMESQGHTLRAVVDTAGKSLHGWFDYPDPGCIPGLIQDLTALKCDPNMFRPSQPCRLPGALRDGKYQRLIYFNNEQCKFPQ